MHRLQIMQRFEPSKINCHSGALDMEKTPQEKEKEKEENCECGLKEDSTWSEEVFDRFGCTCK